jgi:UDP-glucose 4-epimerase
MSGVALVTGACGFIGRHAARRLAREGWEVRGLGHGRFDAAERERWGLREFISADVTLASLGAGGWKPDLLVHCAGGSTVGYSLQHPHEDFERTVATTAAVLEYARTRATAARVVFLSSAAVYGEAGNAPLPEDARLAPVSPYGVHKRIGEELCRLYGAHFGLRLLVIRFFSVYGAGMRKQLLWDASNRLRVGDAVFGGTGGELRDWLNVEDAAALIVRAQALAAADCPVINGGTGAGVAVAEILRALSAGLGARDAPRFSGERRAGDPVALVADNSRALAAGWRPRVDWREGVREYAAWHLQNAP